MVETPQFAGFLFKTFQTMYTPVEAIEAIKARISGEWDNMQHLKIGALSTTLEDIGRIIEQTLLAD